MDLMMMTMMMVMDFHCPVQCLYKRKVRHPK